MEDEGIEYLNARIASRGQSSEWQSSENKEPTPDDSDVDNSSGGESDALAPEVVPGQCLFCSLICSSPETSISHMLHAHHFTVPFQDFLSVEIDTLIWYLHLIINGYHECICCGTRRSTLEAVQQHMAAKGHCRFEVVGEFADFYDLETAELSKSPVRIDEASLRLSSGKILTHRSHAHLPTRNHGTSQLSPVPSPQPQASTEEASRSDALDKVDRTSKALVKQMSSLRASDQKSLAHLSPAEQRSVLSTRKRQLDIARRAEKHYQAKLQRQGNQTLRWNLGKGPGLMHT